MLMYVDACRYVGGGYLSAGGSWVALTNHATGDVTIVIEKMAWEDVNEGEWRQKYFPQKYTTATETLTFVLPSTGKLSSSSASGTPLGVWRSHFRAVTANQDPGAWADPATNTSYLVRDTDFASAHTDAGANGRGTVTFAVKVERDEMVTLTTAVKGVPPIAPVLPHPPASAANCTWPRDLVEDFDGLAAGTEARYFQGMHGAFEAVEFDQAFVNHQTTHHRHHSPPFGQAAGPWRGMVLRQMSVGQPTGFHGTDNPPLTVVGAQAQSSLINASVDFYIIPSNSTDTDTDTANAAAAGSCHGAVLGVGITDTSCGPCGVYLQICSTGQWSLGNAVTSWQSGSIIPATPNTPTAFVHGNSASVGKLQKKAKKPWRSGSDGSVTPNTWHRVQLIVTPQGATASIDGRILFDHLDIGGKENGLQGWVGIGSTDWGPVLYDSFEMHSIPP